MRALIGRRSLSACLLGTAILLGACHSGGGSGSGPTPAGGQGGATTTTTSARAAGTSRLSPSQIVLQRADAPPGTVYQRSGSGRQSLDAIVRGEKDAAKEKALLKSAGFSGSYLSLFTGLQLPTSVRQGHLVESFAAVFASPSVAATGLRSMISDLAATGHRLTHLPTSGLPTGAVALRGDLTTINGHSYFYGWTAGNAALMLIDAGGDQTVDAATSLQLATQIARRIPPGSHPASQARAMTLPTSAAPLGTQYDATRSGDKTVTDLASTPANAAALKRLGFRAAYVTAFLSPGFLHPTTAKPTTGGQGDFVASQAQRYRSPADAHRAYELFRAREQHLFGSRMHQLPTTGLGADADAFQYVDPKSTGDIYGFGYFWRRGSLVLSLFDVGSARFARQPEAQKLAHIMDARTK